MEPNYPLTQNCGPLKIPALQPTPSCKMEVRGPGVIPIPELDAVVEKGIPTLHQSRMKKWLATIQYYSAQGLSEQKIASALTKHTGEKFTKGNIHYILVCGREENAAGGGGTY